MVALNLGDDKATVTKYAKEGKFTFPLLLNSDKTVQAYGVQAFPTNYVIGPDGKVKARFVGFNEQKLVQALRALGVK